MLKKYELLGEGKKNFLQSPASTVAHATHPFLFALCSDKN